MPHLPVALALGATRLMEGLLFGVEHADPVSLVGGAALLAVVAPHPGGSSQPVAKTYPIGYIGP